MSESIGLAGLASLTNTKTNAEIANKVLGNHGAVVHSFVPLADGINDWIVSGVPDADGYTSKDQRLVNMTKYGEHLALVKDGKTGLKDSAILNGDYINVVEEADNQRKLLDANPGMKAERLVGAAATGSNLTETPYETVRRVNYLTGIVGKSYFLADFTARDMVNIRSVNVLNAVGFKKTGDLLTGIPEIGDFATPPPMRQDFDEYNKALHADSFHYVFGMREVRDTAFSLVQQITSEIPGIFAKMKDDKITAALNAKTPIALGGTWDAIAAGNSVYDNDAAEDVETSEEVLRNYVGQKVMLAEKKVIRVYRRNTGQVGIGAGPKNSESLTPAAQRRGRLMLNQEVLYAINQNATANRYYMAVKQQWADLLQSMVINVSYRNQMVPGQPEGRLTFDYNGFMEKDAAALDVRSGIYT